MSDIKEAIEVSAEHLFMHHDDRDVFRMDMARELDSIANRARADERRRIAERAKDGMVMEEIAYALFSVTPVEDSDDPLADYFRDLAGVAVSVFLNPIICQLQGEPAIGIDMDVQP